MAKGFKHGAGGGAPLNFKIVGNPQPEDPKENTIWLNTDKKITGWTITADEPAIHASEELYTEEGATANVYLNASGAETAVSDGAYKATDYIALPDGTQQVAIKTVGTATSVACHAFYDADGNFISASLRTVGTTMYDVPENAVSMRLSIRTDDASPSVIAYINSAKDGAVWISVGRSGPVSFNALKKNGITVCPMSAKQYIDGAWVDVTAQIYQGGEWVPWVVYYYKPGDTCDAVTGGIYAQNTSYTTFTDTHIEMFCGYQQAFCIRTQNMVDLTNIRTLYLKMNNLRTNNADTYVKFCVTDKITTNVNDTFDASVRYDAGASETGTNPSLIMDVSNVTGEKYIYVFLQNALKYTESYVNIVEIRGE